METILKYLADDIQTIEQCNQSMDSASWGYEEGILLTGNQAKAILEHTGQLKSDKEELLSILKGLVSDVGNLIGEHDIEWQQAGYFECAKEVIQKHKQ